MVQIATLICQLALWLGGMVFVHREERRENFPLRMLISSAIVIVLCVLLAVRYDGVSMYQKMVIQAVSTVYMMLFLICNWKIRFSVGLFYFIWTRIVWWLTIETWQFAMVFLQRFQETGWILRVFFLILNFVATYLLCDITIAKWIPDYDKKRIGPRQLVSALLICVIFELLAYTSELQHVTAQNVDKAFPLFLLQWISAIILYLQNELFRKSSMKQELELVTLLLQKEQEQYRLSKENIAIINQKCHDLKHQIRAVRQVNEAERDEYLKEIEKSVSIYEAIVKTGNEVLDTILTEKSLYCRDRGITISCVADGKLLEFIHHMDLYSLFGNALDNAIEAVEGFEEQEKRQIDVLVYRQQNFLVVNIINPMKDSLTLENEMPVTTKKDKNLHGFGIRSMKYIIKKYDGFFNITEEDGCFSLKFLFPIQ